MTGETGGVTGEFGGTSGGETGELGGAGGPISALGVLLGGRGLPGKFIWGG